MKITMHQSDQKFGWSLRKPLREDGSLRRYYRMEKDGRTAVLMHCIGETPGHSLDDFLRIGIWLREAGLSAPDIYEQEDDFLLMEDFGDVSFKAALKSGMSERELYTLALQVLDVMKEAACDLMLPDYFASHVHENKKYLITHYFPHKGLIVSDELMADYLGCWRAIEQALPSHTQAFCHIDYHVENLMVLENRDGLNRCGILDFQGAMQGPACYDAANLLEDPRYEISAELYESLLNRFDDPYRQNLRVRATQFHCRLLGQFIKLSQERGNPVYMEYLPRLERYLHRGLQDPVLAPLKSFFDKAGLEI